MSDMAKLGLRIYSAKIDATIPSSNHEDLNLFQLYAYDELKQQHVLIVLFKFRLRLLVQLEKFW